MRTLSPFSQIAAISLAICSSVIAQTGSGVDRRSDNLEVKDQYSNYDYAYSVRIPKGLSGSRSPAPFPNHGFVIQLSDHASLAIDASYNAALWHSFDEAIEAYKNNFKREVGGEVSVVAQAPAVLGKLKAVRFLMKHKSAATPEVREVLLAFREADGEVGIVYEIALTTSSSRYDKDKRLIDDVQRTWKLKSLPKPVSRNGAKFSCLE